MKQIEAVWPKMGRRRIVRLVSVHECRPSTMQTGVQRDVRIYPGGDEPGASRDVFSALALVKGGGKKVCKGVAWISNTSALQSEDVKRGMRCMRSGQCSGGQHSRVGCVAMLRWDSTRREVDGGFPCFSPLRRDAMSKPPRRRASPRGL